MPHLGLPEFLMLPFVAFVAALPVCTFVFAFLTYRAVKRIEMRLNQPS
jgi:hypothetical protein